MVTTVTVKVGATNTPVTMDYSSMLTMVDACPADLTASNEIWQAEVYNQGVLTISSKLTWTTVTDATRYVILTAVAGAAFYENGTGALRYNNSNGAAIEGTIGYNGLFNIVTDYITISRLQFRNSSANSNYVLSVITNAGNSQPGNCLIDQCIFSTPVANGNRALALQYISVITLQNSLIVVEAFSGTNNGGIYCLSNGMQISNCTIASPSNLTAPSGSHAINSAYTFVTANNTAMFGFLNTILFGGGGSGINSNTSHNSTNLSSVAGSTSDTDSVAYTTTNFVQPSASGGVVNSGGALDLRLTSGSALIGQGLTAGMPTYDILNSLRTGVANDIGAFQENVGTAAIISMFVNIV